MLIHSAAGGVGIYANRIAKEYNAYTIGTIGSESKRNFLLNEGYDEVIRERIIILMTIEKSSWRKKAKYCS